jgi:hypothetical protein
MELRPSPDIGKLNALRDPILANTAVLEEYRSRFLIRELDKDRFAQVISSVTLRSVLFFGVVSSENREATRTEAPVRLISMITLPVSVHNRCTIGPYPDPTGLTIPLKGR